MATSKASMGPQGITHNAGKGKSLWLLGDLYIIKVTGDDTGGSYSFLEAKVMPQNGPPPHIHRREDEGFWVLEGEFSFLLGSQTLKLSTGAFAHVPKNTLHTFKNEGKEPGRLLVLISPAGLERLFERVGEPVTDPSSPPPVTQEKINQFVALAPEYHLEIKLPSQG